MPVNKKNSNSMILMLSLFLFIVLAITLYLTTTYRTELFSREIKQAMTQSDSTEVEDIEKDLLNTDLDGLDKELQDIEEELDQL